MEDVTPRILVVDNERRQRIAYGRLLESWGYMPVIPQGSKEELLAEAKRMAREHRCHLALVDMRLMDNDNRNDKSGIELIKYLEPAKSILLTGFGDMKAGVEAIAAGAVDAISKEALPQEIKDHIDKELEDVFCNQHFEIMEISWPHKMTSASVAQLLCPEQKMPSDEVTTAIRKVFCKQEASFIRLRNIEGALRTPRFSAHTQKVVLKAELSNSAAQVLKLARRAEIDKEVERYKKYILNKLNGGNYAHQIKNELRWAIGACTYEYHSGSVTFTEYFRQNPAPQIYHVLEQLCNKVWQIHYRNAPWNKISRCKIYTDVWGTGWRRRVDSYLLTARDERSFVSLRCDLIDPVSWLNNHHEVCDPTYQKDKDELPQAVIHGDLRGDNFLVDDHQQLSLIDFERTGPGPLAQDFVELEVDILTNISAAGGIEEHNLAQFCELVISVLDSSRLDRRGNYSEPEDDNLKKASKVIFELRRIANHYMLGGPEENRLSEYLYGLLFNTVFRATWLTDAHDVAHVRERSFLLGSLICYRLNYFGNADWVKNLPPDLLKRLTLQFNRTNEPSLRNKLGSRRELRDQIRKSFNSDELKIICADNKVSYDELGDGNKFEAFIEYFEKRDELDRLLNILMNERRTIPWSTFFTPPHA